MHSEQTAQSRQRLASATACSSEKPVLTSSQTILRAAPGRCGMGMRAMTAVCSKTASSGLASSITSSSMGRRSSPRRKLWMLRAARRPAATASMAVHGALAAASPPANTPFLPVPSVALSVRIWPFSTVMPLDPSRKSSTMLWPMAKMTVSHSSSYSEPAMATGGRQPRSSGSPSEQARNSTLRARPESSVTICDGMHEQLKAMLSSRPSVSSSSEAGTLWSSSIQLMVTFSAPSRSAVRPASKATSPPPMTTTFLPMSTFSPSEAALSTLTASRTPLASAPGTGRVRPPCRPTAR